MCLLSSHVLPQEIAGISLIAHFPQGAYTWIKPLRTVSPGPSGRLEQVRTSYRHCLFLKQRNCLIVSTRTALDDKELAALGDQVAELVVQYRSNCAVVDLSGLDVVDSFSVRSLRHLCTVLDLHSVKTVIIGIRPAVAVSMALRGLALGLKNDAIAGDLSDALTLLEEAGGHVLPPGESYPRLH